MFKQSEKIQFIVNPTSAHGATAGKWHRIEKKLRREGFSFDVNFTKRPWQAVEMTRSALREGSDLIIAVGGDGTINEVINGFYDIQGEKISTEACFSALPMGSGSDFARGLNLTANMEDIISICQGGREFACDIVKACFNSKGSPQNRYLINVADVGLGSAIARKVNQQGKHLGGFWSFLLASVTTVLQAETKELRLTIDGCTVYEGGSNLVAVANGQYFGGGMRIAPTARLDDGSLDVIVLRALNRWELIYNLPRVYTGSHVFHPKVSCYQGKRVEITSPGELLLEMDGEIPGGGNCSFEVIPGAFKLIIPWDRGTGPLSQKSERFEPQ